ncbi:hypothetical protein PMAG_a0424 [Pseudoalteromonas mariniglutinosa NCIMB 1770]|nr:hypothetical protein [Pseudoalteromonas mariniglutinosa NCIMB 1770]
MIVFKLSNALIPLADVVIKVDNCVITCSLHILPSFDHPMALTLIAYSH